MLRPTTRIYDEQDLRPFAGTDLELLRRREALTFRGGYFNAEEIVAGIVEDALLANVCDVQVERLGDWWVIWSKTDWFPNIDVMHLFTHINAQPQLEQNSMRPEAILTAFCPVVLTATHGTLIKIKGEPAPAVMTYIAGHNGAARLIAFQPAGPLP